MASRPNLPGSVQTDKHIFVGVLVCVGNTLDGSIYVKAETDTRNFILSILSTKV